MEKEQVIISLDAFSEMELANIREAASEKEMTLEQFISFLFGWCPTK